jgi:uncharacterized membrane protein YfcA
VEIQVAIIFTGFWGFPQAILQVIRYRHFLDKFFLQFFLPTVIPGIYLGIWLIIYLPAIWMQIIIGFFIIGYVLYKFHNQTWKKNQLDTQSEKERATKPTRMMPKWAILTGGFTYGTISSWIGTPGPISIVFLEISGHYREKFIANNTAIVVLAGIFKLTLYLTNSLFPVEYLWFFLGGLGLCFIATKLGHITTPKISMDKFQLIINLILAFVGFRMVFTGFLDII